MTLLGLAFVGVVVVLQVGCEQNPPQCDECGVAGSGGGVAGSGGAGGGPTELPSCLRELTADCPRAGICGRDVFVTQTTAESCAPGGVNGRYVVEVRKADGSLCYTTEQYVPSLSFCESSQVSWKDPSGRVVASGGFGWGATVTCKESGEMVACAQFDIVCPRLFDACTQ